MNGRHRARFRVRHRHLPPERYGEALARNIDCAVELIRVAWHELDVRREMARQEQASGREEERARYIGPERRRLPRR